MRNKLIVANWKMYKTIQETRAFLEQFRSFSFPAHVEAWIAVPFTALHAAVSYVKEHRLPIKIGAQNIHQEKEGAFTGEISGVMLEEAGAHFAIIGHSERRKWFHENDMLVQAKIRGALLSGIAPLLCVGESKEERESGEIEQVLSFQLATALQGLPPPAAGQFIIAYEPLWAIGTGNTATPDLAQEAHRICRAFLARHWGAAVSQKVSLLYGGSVKPDNVRSLISEPDIDGALVGGASLDAHNFGQLILKVKG